METLRRRFLVTVSLFMLMVTFLFVPTMTGRAEDATPTEPTKTPPTEWTEQPTIDATVLDATQASCDISSKEDLYGLNAWIKNNSNTNLTINLNADIVVNDGVINADTDEFGVYLWIPINADCNITFNGNGHTISGLYFNDSTRNNVGFFGACEGSVKVSKLGIINSYFNGGSNVGAFAGTLGKGSVIKECYSQSTVSASNAETLGGIAAVLLEDATISSCYNIGDVKCAPTSYNSNVTNSCYVTAGASGLATYNGTGSAALTDAEFKSGAAAYLLSGGLDDVDGIDETTAWGQKLTPASDGSGATTNKSYPVFSDDKVYSGKASCTATQDTYINGVVVNFHTTVVKHAATGATCQADGNEEYYECTACSKIVAANENGIFVEVEGKTAEDYKIAATGHEDVLTNTEQYTKFLFNSKTLVDGEFTHTHIYRFICTKCGEVVTDENGDEVTDEVSANDSVVTTQTGGACLGITTTHYCADCGYEQVIKTAGTGTHTEVVYCTEGYHWTMCSECKTVTSAKAEHTIKVTTPASDATCTVDGATEGSECEVCGRIMAVSQVIPATGHNYSEWTTTLEATCTVAGSKERTCYTCGETFTEEIAATGHTEVEVAQIDPTCEEAGCTAGVKCSVCDEILRGCQTITALGHVEVTDAAVEATCTATGLTEGKHCSVCSKVLIKQEVVAAKGHTEEVMAAVAATCTTDGLTEGKKCSVCQTVLIAQQVVPAAHTPETLPAQAPTCTQEGWSILVQCSVCQAEIKKVAIAALGHDIVVDEAVAATCTQTGREEGSHCSRCSDATVVGDEIAALGHDIVIDARVEATCTEVGHEEGSHCSRCDEATVVGNEIAALGHDMVTDEAVAATCTTDGREEGSHCSRCDETTGGAVIPATGHTWVYHAAVAATCTTEGSKDYLQCSVCNAFQDENDTEESVKIPALGHAWEDVARLEPTCTTDGHKAYQHCTRCGEDSMTEEERKLEAHHVEEEIPAVAPTCTSTGLTAGKRCSVCGEIIEAQQEVAKAEHDLEEVAEVPATCTTPGHTAGQACKNCDHVTYTETPATGHTFDAQNPDMGWAYDETNGITSKVVLHCSNTDCEETFDKINCTVTVAKGQDNTLVATGKFTYNGTAVTKTLTFNVTEELTQTSAGFDVVYDFTQTDVAEGAEAISFTKTSAATSAVSDYNNTITYTATTTVNGVTFTTTRVFDMGNISYSWSKAGDGYELIAIVGGKTETDGTLRLVAQGVKSEERDENGVLIKTIYTAKVQVGDYVIATKTKEIAEDLKYTVTVVNGSFADGTTSQEIAYGTLVTLEHIAAEYGEHFVGWYVGDELVSQKDSYSFHVTKNVTVTAKFAKEAPEAKAIVNATVTERVDDAATGKQKVTVTIEWSLPEGFEFVEAGFNRIYVTPGSDSTNLEETLKTVGGDVKNAVANLQTKEGTYEFNLTLSATTKLKDMYFIGYIKYKDADGQEQVMYTNLMSSLASKS